MCIIFYESLIPTGSENLTGNLTIFQSITFYKLIEYLLITQLILFQFYFLMNRYLENCKTVGEFNLNHTHMPYP